MNGRNRNTGFTLVEILVAVSIFLVLMGGLTMLFIGSLRATQTTLQQMDAFERARGALAILDDDLTIGFASRIHGQKDSFYGTPIGMTFIGVTRDSNEAKDVNIARITYVIYNPYEDILEGSGMISEVFPGAFDGADAYTYFLLRFVEPGVGDLDSFPVNWGQVSLSNADVGGSITTVGAYIDWLADERCDDDKCKDEFRKNKRREYWIRMLAGGDNEVPNWWKLRPDLRGGPPPELVEDQQAYKERNQSRNFVVTEHVIWPVEPWVRVDKWLAGFDDGFPGRFFFQYKDANSDAAYTWWNDLMHTNCLQDGGTIFDPNNPNCADMRLPEIVNVQLWLMFASPYPSAPDFQRQFTMEIHIPTAFRRAANIE